MIMAVLQARLSSTRLPGKVMAPILGEPMIARQMERLQRVKGLDQIIIATSREDSDDPLAAFVRERRWRLYRGNLKDVLRRVYQAVFPYNPEHVVRLTADCPLADPALIEELIRFHLSGGYDYTSLRQFASLPDGLDAEIMRFSALETAYRQAQSEYDREHVTPYIHTRPEKFRLGKYSDDRDLGWHRWTVDTEDDLKFVRSIYAALYRKNPEFDMADILGLLSDQPDLISLNNMKTVASSGERFH